MAETRTLYIAYSIDSPRGVGVGRNTVALSSEASLPSLLSMADISNIEAQNLAIVRETVPDARSVVLTWWTEIRSEPSP